MPPFDFTKLMELLTINAQLGPSQFAVIAATVLIVKFLKDSPAINTPKSVRPWLYLGAGIVCNVALEYVVGNLALKPLIAEQLVIWFTTLGIRHLVDAPRAVDPRRP